jgi:3-oxoacyl-[acyl-carrier protein] reductase
MDFGIAGRRALVCGGSSGLGFECAAALAAEGAAVTVVARREQPLLDATRQLRSRGLTADCVVADVASEAGRAQIAAAVSEVDILVNNAGGPPPGQFRAWSREDWIAAFDANTLSAVFLTRAYIDGMISRRFGRILNITSIAVKQPQGVLGLSTSARLALTGFVSGLSKEVAEHNVTVNNLLPGYFATDRLQRTFVAWSEQSGQPLEETVAARQEMIPAKRFGDPQEFGEVCAFLCSRQASYLTGQNILLDGGLYPGVF